MCHETPEYVNIDKLIWDSRLISMFVYQYSEIDIKTYITRNKLQSCLDANKNISKVKFKIKNS